MVSCRCIKWKAPIQRKTDNGFRAQARLAEFMNQEMWIWIRKMLMAFCVVTCLMITMRTLHQIWKHGCVNLNQPASTHGMLNDSSTFVDIECIRGTPNRLRVIRVCSLLRFTTRRENGGIKPFLKIFQLWFDMHGCICYHGNYRGQGAPCGWGVGCRKTIGTGHPLKSFHMGL